MRRGSAPAWSSETCLLLFDCLELNLESFDGQTGLTKHTDISGSALVAKGRHSTVGKDSKETWKEAVKVRVK